MASGWKEDCVLGQGSFGFVRLFVNEPTKEKIALKEMKIATLEYLTPSEREVTRKRLETEIEIMQKYTHENLVKAMKKPENMPYSPGKSVIHVWMEYCDGGDLRKNGLSLPPNCCGLLEVQIRRILSHINAGLIFLHRNHIIHRDLKPENILLKIDPISGQTVYKLTDFGYAKTYENSSYSKSMVGTPQYVAPEILNTREHGRTVDFWSFGVVVFELCTGTRPFLHISRGPFDWVNPTCNKPDDCIHIYWPERGNNVVTSNTIPRPNNLSSIFAEMLTKWLKMALHISPDKRGGVAINQHEDAPCLVKMENVLRTRILQMLCMSTGEKMEMTVTSKDSLSSVRQWLVSRGYSNPDTVYIVTKQGRVISPNQHVDNICTAFFVDDAFTSVIYLYNTDLQPSFKLVQQVLPSVTTLLALGDEKIEKDDRPTVYGHVYHHLREFWRLFDMLYDGHKAIMIDINELEKELKKLVYPPHPRGSGSLLVDFCRTLGAADQTVENVLDIQQLLVDNGNDLKLLGTQCNIQQMIDEWSLNRKDISDKINEMQASISEVQRVQKESEQVLVTTEVMSQRHMCSQKHFEEFHKEYIDEALRFYRLAKANGTCSDMAGLLQLATDQAENIIQDDLNGADYLSVYLKLLSLVNQANGYSRLMQDIKRDCDEFWPKVSQNMLSLILPNMGGTRSLYNTQTSHSSDTVNRPFTGRSESVSSNTSSTAAIGIISRLSSVASINGSFDEGTEDSGVDELLKSLKEQINLSVRHSETNVGMNKEMLSRLKSSKEVHQSQP